jgi:hypothetical protein
MDGQSSTGDRWFALRCDARWENMPVVDADRAVRRCERCERTVHLCRTVAQFEGHARHGNCVAVLESGPFARVVTNSCEAPQAPEDAPSAENPFDPLDADGSQRQAYRASRLGTDENPEPRGTAPRAGYQFGLGSSLKTSCSAKPQRVRIILKYSFSRSMLM